MFQSGIEFNQQKGGWIEVVCGPMFSGKTEELIRRMRRAQIAGQKVEIFKPASDIRYDEQEVVSHDKNSILYSARQRPLQAWSQTCLRAAAE